MSNSNLRFSYIDIEGYRGRNFKLDMDKSKDNHVFVMDGNTGKTTTIELLKWCFNYKESNAENNFRHMFTDPAHVLDWDYPDKLQECKIEIGFSKDGHDYKFRRITTGEHSLEKGEKEVGDIIKDISDALEVDRGDKVFHGDKVNEKLTKMKISTSADYFLFDGERAREFMMYASDKEKVHKLIDAINRRVVPPKLTEYSQKLNELEKRIYEELGSKASKSGRTRVINKISDIKLEIDEAIENKQSFIDKIEIRRRKMKELDERIEELNQSIYGLKSETIEQKYDLKENLSGIRSDIDKNRRKIVNNLVNLISENHDHEVVNGKKEEIREKGNLPEPYREDLISVCLNSKPPTCEICGTELDNPKIEKVKKLKEQVASHKIQQFLTNNLSSSQHAIDIRHINEEIRDKLDENEEILSEIKGLELSEKEEELINERKKKRKRRNEFQKEIGDYEGEISALDEFIENKEKEKKELQEKSETLEEYSSVLNEIDEAQRTIKEAKDKIKDKTIEIISETLGKSVKYMLGDNFSAKLTEDSLLLGQNERYHREVGGMSGKLVLSYCFAESMTQVSSMVIDTPVGNLDDKVRRKLAKHLKENHEQIILLCLPPELDYFADELSPQKERIENGSETTWLKN